MIGKNHLTTLLYENRIVFVCMCVSVTQSRNNYSKPTGLEFDKQYLLRQGVIGILLPEQN